MMMLWSENETRQAEGTGVVVNVARQDALLADLQAHIEARCGFSLATLNLDHVVKLRSSTDFAAAYRRHSHVTADGNPIVWLSRLAGQDVSLIPGSDLVLPVAHLAAETGAPLALLGATEASLAGAAEVLQTRCPGLRVVAQLAPPMGFDPTGQGALDYVAALKASGAQLCFVALGAPKQELFAAFAAERLPHMGFLSIGASLDFLSGHQTRAPKLVRRLAAEWLWRLAQNPRRLAARYGACLLVLPGLLVRALATRMRRSAMK